MIIIRRLLAFSRVLAMLLSLSSFLAVYGISCIFKKHTPERGFALRSSWMKVCAFLWGVKLTFEPSPDDLTGEAILFIGNHRTFSDPLYFAKYLHAYIIAKAEVSNIPIVALAAQVTGIVFVDRQSKFSRASARLKMVELLEDSKNVLVYAEGTTSVEDTTLAFKSGSFKEAASRNIAVVPVAIMYHDKKDHWDQPSMVKQFLKQFGKWRSHVTLAAGPKMKNEDHKVLMNECRNWINERILKGI